MATSSQIVDRMLNDQEVQAMLAPLGLSTKTEQKKYLMTIFKKGADVKKQIAKEKRMAVPLDLPNEYVAFDLETTGISNKDEITQIGAVHFKDGKEVAQFESLVQIGGKVPAFVTHLTGITNQMLLKAPRIDYVLGDFDEFVGDLPLVAHNGKSFDIPFLRRYGVDYSEQFLVDTLNLAKNAELDTDSYKLEVLKSYFGIIQRGHDALGDARATALILERIREEDIDKRETTAVVREPFFKGMTFAISGKLGYLSQAEAEKIILKHAGTLSDKMNTSVDFFVNGNPDLLTGNVNDSMNATEKEWLKISQAGAMIPRINGMELRDLERMGRMKWREESEKK